MTDNEKLLFLVLFGSIAFWFFKHRNTGQATQQVLAQGTSNAPWYLTYNVSAAAVAPSLSYAMPQQADTLLGGAKPCSSCAQFGVGYTSQY